MRTLNETEKKMLNCTIKFASPKQLFIVSWWSIFNNKKIEKLIECVSNGMNWEASYLTAKNINNDD